MGDPIFWTCDDAAESLSHSDMDECIEEYLDNFWPSPYEFKDKPPQERIDAFLAALPKQITAYGYMRTRIKADDLDGDAILEASVGRLEEDEWGDPDGVSWEDRMTQEAVEKVKGAVRVLIDTIVENYVPWSCECATQVQIDPVAWIRANHPEWLDPKEETA